MCVSILQCCVPGLVLTSNMMYAPVSGAGSTSIRTFRERSSLWKSSRLQMVTLSQPATHPFRRGYANTCQSVASTEAIPVAEHKSVMWLMFGRDPHRGPSTCLPVCPVSTLIQHSTKCDGRGAREPWAMMIYPSSNLLQPNAKVFLVGRHVIYLRLQRCERRARSSQADSIPVPSPGHCPNRGASRYLLRREEVVPHYRTSCAITRCREIMTPQLSIVKTRFAKASLRPRCARHRSSYPPFQLPNACVGYSATNGCVGRHLPHS